MKVLHIYKTYMPDSIGGVEQVIKQTVIGTSKLGVTSEVLSLSDKNISSIINDHTSHRCKSNIEIASTPISVSALFCFIKLSREADIIHYHFPYPFADILNLFKPKKTPCIVTYHSDIVKQKRLMKLYQPLQNHFLSRVNKIIATSPNYLKTSETLTKYKNKVEIIPIGLDRDSYPIPCEDRIEFWKKR